jgi:hypothetical protein
LHDEGLHNLYPLSDIIRIIKSRRMGEMKKVYKVWLENIKERNYMEIRHR